jgi:predicted MFS family arabinose efflux permease
MLRFFQAAMARPGLQKEFGVSTPVAILGISLFVEGLGCGPLLLGPLSEFFGRRHIYWISFVFFVLLNLPVAFSPNIGERGLSPWVHLSS